MFEVTNQHRHAKTLRSWFLGILGFTISSWAVSDIAVAQHEDEDSAVRTGKVSEEEKRNDDGVRFVPPRGMNPRWGEDEQRRAVEGRGHGPGRGQGFRRNEPGETPANAPRREEIEAFIHEHFPMLSVELDRVRRNNPRVHERRFSRLAPQIARLMDLYRRDPPQGALLVRERRLDMEMRLLAMRFRRADNDADRDRIQRQLREAAGEFFDIRHERRSLEIQEMETRITELRERHEQAARLREPLIEREVRERLERPFPEAGPDEDD